MTKTIRLLIVIAAAVAVLALAGSHIAWAGTSGEQVQYAPAASNFQPELSEPKGTVKPPGCKGITIIATGKYSVCGLAVVDVTMKQEGVVFYLYPQKHTTKGAGNVIVGAINLSSLIDHKKDMGPYDEYADIKICYAVLPGTDVEVKFYDKDAKAWTALPTTIEDGQACAPANYSGDYVLVGK